MRHSAVDRCRKVAVLPVFLCFGLACEPWQAERAPARPIATAAADVETAAAQDAVAPGATPPASAGFCVPPERRSATLDGAWPNGDRIVFCVTRSPEADAGSRSCASVGRDGEYRAEPDQTGPKPPLLAASFDDVSADGRFKFELTGGDRRPHRAIGILRDARSTRILKKAPVPYDEHLESLGWVGQQIALKQWVEEGPGCTIGLYDPSRWPLSALGGGNIVAGCYGGFYVLKPSPGVFAVVDAVGGGVTFLDESTFAGTNLDTGRDPDAESDTRAVTWVEGDAVLVQAYGPPWTGDVVRLDLKRRTRLTMWSPPGCK